MSESQAAPPKPSLLQMIRIGWRPYRRLYGYVKPYRWRFIVGIASGGLFGVIASLMPLVLAKVTSVIFQGAPASPQQLAADPSLLNAGPKLDSSIIWMCLALPGIMMVRSLFSYCNAYYMQWVSNRALTDIRDELFAKMLHHSMDFYNRMHSGFLMSRITNDTRGMQAALSTISSDLFKQPVTIISCVSVLLYMDWKFTLVTLVLFPRTLPDGIVGEQGQVLLLELAVVGQVSQTGDDIADLGLVGDPLRQGIGHGDPSSVDTSSPVGPDGPTSVNAPGPEPRPGP